MLFLITIWICKVGGSFNRDNLYPNPSDGRINFLISGEEDKLAKVKIYTLLGQLVFEKSVIFNNGRLVLDLSDKLSQQNYMLKIRMFDGEEHSKIISIE